MRQIAAAVGVVLLSTASRCPAALPAAPEKLIDFPITFDPAAPGDFAADFLIPRPAAKDGRIVVRDGHFYSGEKRVRFLGVNFCFSASFPTHEAADVVARRLARFGVNIVRFHHMDSQPFPNGLFERNSDRFSSEALDRLDYLIAALKKNGIYADLNLHVAHSFSQQLKLPGAEDSPRQDKMIDLFDPTLIEAEKNYARMLLGHVNPYTGNAYTAEPAVAMIELNNENTFFIWGGDQTVEKLPAPFAAELQARWNDWLKKKYPTRDALESAWNAGVDPLGPNMTIDPKLATAGAPTSAWRVEQHEGAQLTAAPLPGDTGVRLASTKLSGPAWHLQFTQSRLQVRKDHQYTLTFKANVPRKEQATTPRNISVSVSQAHDPWKNLGLSATATVTSDTRQFTFYFTATDSDDNARISFALGDALGPIDLSSVTLTPGGQQGLEPDEDFTGANQEGVPSVRIKSAETPMTAARRRDWYDFLQSLDEEYFTGMYHFVRDELHAQAPITGTIGLGALGTLSQTKMDFVDAHAYWQHPRFPGKEWDSKNWTVANTPLVDSPTFGTMPELAAIRVAGKPFTVTEYNHPAPSDWREECVPEIATIAALQDWDAIFLFAYSHTVNYERDHVNSFFDMEGDPAKMAMLPVAARIFVSGAVQPLKAAPPVLVTKEESLQNAQRYYYNLWPQLRDLHQVKRDVLLHQQLSIAFDATRVAPTEGSERLSCKNDGAGTGQFVLNDPHAAVFVGFPHGDIALGALQLTEIHTPFLVATLTASDGATPLAQADHLLLTVGARVENHNMGWNADRSSVGTQWGKGPTEIEPVQAQLQLPPEFSLPRLDSAGKAVGEPLKGKINLSDSGTMWYRIDRATP